MAASKSDNAESASRRELPPKSGRTLALGLVGSLLCYLAHPPVGWSLLAWIGPVPWLLLARADRLPGRRPYLALWLAGAVYWLAAIQWIRLPHWANIFGLFFLAAYLGAYLPVFVGLTRVAVHCLRAPLWVAGPIVWTGLELARAHLLSGFLMASLAHTQVESLRIIQLADLVGEYGVSFLIILVAACLANAAAFLSTTMARSRQSIARDAAPLATGWPGIAGKLVATMLPAACALGAATGYGQWFALENSVEFRIPRDRAWTRIVLIQSDMLSDWKGTPERDRKVMEEQIELSLDAVRTSDKPVDLIVWPETMFRSPLFVDDPQNPPPTGAIHPTRYTAALSDLKSLAVETGAALLVGIDRVLAARVERPGEEPDAELLVYNAAAFVNREGELVQTYEKMHLLPFGEYIPFAAWVPSLAALAPITGNSLWGSGPAAFELDGAVYSPNICYETVLPHLIRRQVVELARQGKTPDVLVNLTNDSWFWGSSELDMHLASGVFRAIEMRTPLVVAANRGLTAHVSHTGRVGAVTERDRADALTVDVRLPLRTGVYPSVYARYGDWFAGACATLSAVLAVVGIANRRRR
jgi:apolipoprotein N-acyltransferase